MRLAILDSEGLLGKEIKETLGTRPYPALDLRLLTTDSDEVGVVTEGVGGAAFIQELSPETLTDLDILIDCSATNISESLALPSELTVLRMTTGGPIPAGSPVVAAINPERIQPGTVMVSPHPAVVALGHLLQPLRRLGLSAASCWSFLPASIHGQRGLDELLDQTRALLSFQGEQPRAVFGHQLAFNALPATVTGTDLALQLRGVFDDAFQTGVQVLQIGVFHGVIAGAQVRLAEDARLDDVLGELASSSFLSASDDPSGVGPVAAVGQRAALLGTVEETSGVAGGFSLWTVLDNLTLGGASNAVDIVEMVGATRH